MSAENAPSPTLEKVRERLRSQGYLDAGLERSIFTAPRASGAIAPTVVSGAVALATASAAAVASRGAAAPTAGVFLLFAALLAVELLPAAAAGAALYLLSRAVRAPERPNRTAALAGAAAAALVFGFYAIGVRRLPPGGRGHPVLALIPVCITAFYFARAARATSLSLTLRRHVSLPDRPAFRRGSVIALILALAASSMSAWRGSRNAGFPNVTVSPRRIPLVVVGLDGVAPQSLALLAPGAPSVSWRRRTGPPPEIWSTIATGVSPSKHGVAAFERASLFGTTAVRPPFFTGWAFRGPLRWAGVAGRLPVSGAERRAYAFWEVASRCGIATSAVNWWASEKVAGAEVVDNSEIAARSRSGAEVDEYAVVRLREARLRVRPLLSAIYLPGADIDREGLSDTARQFVQEELQRAKAGEESLWLIADAGRAGDEGAAVFVDSAATVSSRTPARAEDLAPTILARLGIPPARDLEGSPLAALFAAGALEERRVPTFGTRTSREPAAEESASGREYLRKLKSLGYLN